MAPGTHDAGFGDDTLGDSGRALVRKTILEAVDHQVGRVDDLVIVAVHIGDQLSVCIETEVVDLTQEVVVSIELTGAIDIVAGEVEQSIVRRNDVFVVTTGDILRESIVSSHDGAFGILIGLVEVINADHALLRNIKLALARSCENGADEEQGN